MDILKRTKQVGIKRKEMTEVKGVWIFTIEAWGYMQNTSNEFATEEWELLHGHEEPIKITYGEVFVL